MATEETRDTQVYIETTQRVSGQHKLVSANQEEEEKEEDDEYDEGTLNFRV